MVVASATIDVAPFCAFFELEASSALQVSGRCYPVEVNYQPPPESIQKSPAKLIPEHLIPTLVKALETQKEGHCLVFLPGSPTLDSET